VGGVSDPLQERMVAGCIGVDGGRALRSTWNVHGFGT
jgi:hypothetical protein